MEQGTQLALEGMTNAAEHADRASQFWTLEATRWIERFAAQASGPFTIETVRQKAYASGLPRPPVEGAWGTPTRRLAKAGRIEFVGYRTSHNATQHGKPVKLWAAAGKANA